MAAKEKTRPVAKYKEQSSSLTSISSTKPIAISTVSEAMPARWESNQSVSVPTISGARKAVTVPERANRPKN